MPGRSFYSLNPLVWQPWNDPNYYINLPSGTTQGTKTIGQLEYSKKGKNNVYFNSNSDTDYHNWHALNIVLPFLLSIDPDLAKNIDFQNLSLRTLDKWNNIGGFDYFNRTPQDRKKLLEGEGVKEYLNEFITNPILNKLDQIVGLNRSSSTYPRKPFPNGDSFSRGLIRTTSDPYFGNLMANRRPAIHISVNNDIRLKVFDYYKNLGYTGVYKYSDHWIPTVNENEAEIKFNTPLSELNTSATEILNLSPIQPVTILTPSETLGNPKINLPDLHSSIIRKPLDNGDPKANSNKFDYGKYILKQVPNLLEAVRLAGNLINNLRVYDATLKGINPNLQLGYNLYRQITGDEATKLGYYRRAVLGENLAARPVTSDIDKLIAYQMEAKRVGDELRALGDLADNAEIRRTSDESNLLSWGNRQRAAEVANRNTIELNNAIAAKLNLLALKYSADWTNWDTYLQGIEYRARQLLAKRDALNDLLYQLDEEWRLNNDPRLKDAIKELDAAWEASGQNRNDPKVKAAQEKVRNIQIELAKERIQRYLKEFGLSIFKSGGKTTKTYKWKDDLLYKTAKDTIEHFRKMSKMADDSRLKSRTKPIKFSSHTRKMQLGGVAPFTVFRPIALGGETSLSTTTGGTISSGEKESSSKKSESLEFIKKLFSDMASNKGLPIDVSLIANKILKTFDYSLLIGKELSTSDIASMYISSMLLLSLILHGKELYEDAKKIVTSNDAMDEYAVTGNGNYIVQDKNGNIKEATLLEIAKNNLTPVKNSLLLWMRGFAPNMALEKGDTIMSMFANNAIGMSKIAEYIKAQLPKLSSTELTLLGLTRAESNNVKKGILNLLEEAPSGIYEYTEHTKSNSDLAKAALSYINSILPENMKAVLKLHAAKEGSTVEKLIATLLSTLIEDVLSYKIDAVTGAAAKDSEGNSKGLEINSAVQLLAGMSSPRLFTFNIGNGNSFTGLARISSINDVNETPFGADFSYSEIYKSSLRKNLDLDNACFGDVPINKALKDKIIVDNSTIAGVDLPYTTDSNGRIIPDFKLLSRIEEADKEVMKLGINPEENPQKVNEIYAKHNLPIKYGANNQLTGNYKRFAVILATAVEDVFLSKNGLSSNGTLTLVSDEEEIDRYLDEIAKVTGQKKKDISLDRPELFTGNKDIYKGSIFIPIVGDLVDAISGGKVGKLTENNYDRYRNEWQSRNYVKAPLFIKNE